VIAYNFGDKVLAMKQQAELIDEMKNSNDESLKDAEATFLKMQHNESNLPVLSPKRKITKKVLTTH
jgi:hypothetical protein